MKLFLIVVMWAAFGIHSSSFAAAPVPTWLDAVIKQQFPQGEQTNINPPEAKHVYRYQYKKKTVYFVPSRCCDITATLYDNNGKKMCSPDGGLTGSGDGKCPDFFKTRKNEEIVWPKK